MFKEKMFGKLRDELELYIRDKMFLDEKPCERAEKRSVLCSYKKQEREKDIRIVIRLHKLALRAAEKKARLNRSNSAINLPLNQYRECVLEFIEHNSRLFKKEDLLEKLGASDEASVKDALKKCREWGCFKGKRQIDAVGDMILERKDNSVRNDAYTLVRMAYLDCRLHKLDKNSVLKIASDVYKRNKKKYPVISENAKAVLKAYDGSGDIEGAVVKSVVEELLDAILINQARAFLYDIGLPLRLNDPNDKGDVLNEILADEARKSKKANSERMQNTILNLVDMFMANQGDIGSFADDGALNNYLRSDEFKNRSIAAYNKLEASGKTEVLLPLFIDNMSGSGIFIIGRALVDENSFEESSEDWYGEEKFDEFNVHFGFINWIDLSASDDNSLTYFETRIFLCGNNIEKAIEKFFEEDRFDMYRSINGDMPEGMDSFFERYFETRISGEAFSQERKIQQKEDAKKK